MTDSAVMKEEHILPSQKSALDWLRWTTDILTFEHKLLHLDLVELVGADDDTVTGQMDATARLQSLNLLRYEGRKVEFI